MKCNENDFESKDIQISDNKIKSPIYLNGEKYLMNIYLMTDNINIIFKLEKEKIITYYYSSKFDLKDFNNMSKLFLEDINIQDIFLHLKELFYLILEEQIIDNKLKLNIIKNQITRADKSINIKNNLINKIKITLSNINETIYNINSINNNLLNSNSASTKNSSIESNSISENNSCNNNCTNNNEDYFQEGAKKEKHNSNNKSLSNKKDNNDDDKNNKNENNSDAFFCYDNTQNKKIIEFLIIFNVVTIFMVLYILGSNNNLDLNQRYESEKENKNRLTYLTFIDNSRNSGNFKDIFQENLELQKNKKEGTITNSNLKEEYTENKKKKIQDNFYNYYDYL